MPVDERNFEKREPRVYPLAIISSKIRTAERLTIFKYLLSKRVKENKPISENGMLDGVIIGFILTTSYSDDLLLNNFKEGGSATMHDSTRDVLEQILHWCTENEKSLITILEEI